MVNLSTFKPLQGSPLWIESAKHYLEPRLCAPFSGAVKTAETSKFKPCVFLSEIFEPLFNVETLSGILTLDVLLRVEPLCGTLGNLNFLRVKPWGTCTFMRTFKNGTCMWNLAKPEHLKVEPLCGTWTFNSGTLMWNLVEPQLLTAEPWCGT